MVAHSLFDPSAIIEWKRPEGGVRSAVPGRYFIRDTRPTTRMSSMVEGRAPSASTRSWGGDANAALPGARQPHCAKKHAQRQARPGRGSLKLLSFLLVHLHGDDVRAFSFYCH
jgi:hypothetical protein